MQQDPYSAGFCILYKFEARIGGGIICPNAAVANQVSKVLAPRGLRPAERWKGRLMACPSRPLRQRPRRRLRIPASRSVAAADAADADSSGHTGYPTPEPAPGSRRWKLKNSPFETPGQRSRYFWRRVYQ